MGVPVDAAKIKVISSPAARSALGEIAPQFERSTGNRLLTDFANIAALKKRIAAGEAFDVVFVSPGLIEELLQQGKLAAGTRCHVGRTGLCVITHKGAPRPDVSSADAFRGALLGAKSVIYSATGESGLGFLSALERLGIAVEMKARIRASAHLWRDVEAGEADMGVAGIGAALAHSEIAFAGALPPGIQQYVNLAAGVSASAREPEAARALLKYLGEPAVVQILKSKGLEP
jgi:molybdate transport system substrate-binding protein